MREIKFRVFCERHNREEIYTLGDLIVGNARSENGEGGIFEDWRQYTGLKDKNGTDIYEGDIIGYIDWEGKMRVDGVVRYGEYNCSCCEGVYGWYIDDGDIRAVATYEVIRKHTRKSRVIGGERIMDDGKWEALVIIVIALCVTFVSVAPLIFG